MNTCPEFQSFDRNSAGCQVLIQESWKTEMNIEKVDLIKKNT